MCWLKDFFKKLTFNSNILLELEEINYLIYDFDYVNTFQNQMLFKPIATAEASDESLGSDKTSLIYMSV